MRRELLILGLGVMASGGAVAASPAESPHEIDLRRPRKEQVAASQVHGGDALEWAGSRLASGDVNGDGISDLVIAAPGGTDDRPSRRGRLYVLYGRVDFPPESIDLSLRRQLRTAPGAPASYVSEADVIIKGEDDFDHLGWSLQVADLDRDGFADIIAGAPRGDGPGNSRPDSGQIHVVYGAASLPFLIGLDAPPAGVETSVVHGLHWGDALGTTMAIGDLTGDDRGDIVAGAPLARGMSKALGALDVGAVFVLPVTGRLPRSSDLAAGAPGIPGAFALFGAEPGDQAGSALALGDFDADGAGDLAVGARGADGPSNQRPDSGEVHILLGPFPTGTSFVLAQRSQAVVFAPDIGDLGGSSLAMGDLDGSAGDELVIGAEFADGWRNAHLDAGDVYVLSGRSRQALESLRPPPPERRGRAKAETDTAPAGPVVVDLADPKIPGVGRLHGNDPGDHTGVRGLADLDDDGMMEILIGAADASSRRNGRAGGGEIRVVPGPAALAEHGLDRGRGVVVWGHWGGAHLGFAVAAADLNGDSRPELVAAAPQAGQSLSGTIWILQADWGGLMKPREEGKR